MKVIIIGAGFTGQQLALKLINECYDVCLVDSDEDTIRHASAKLDGVIKHADGNNLKILEECGIAKADALVAVTGSDEINMITCSLVDAVYPDILKIARVRNYAYYVNSDNATKSHAETFKGNHRPLYGIDYMIHPDIEAAEAIVNAVEHGAISDVLSFGDDFEITSLLIEKDSKLDGLQLKNIRNLTEKKLIVVYIENHNSKSGLLETRLPSGDTILHEGDRIAVLTNREDIPEMLDLCGTKIDKIKNITLIGIGKIGTIVAEKIIEKDNKSLLQRLFSGKRKSQTLKIIDTDKDLCKTAEEKFPQAQIFNADATDEDFLHEEGIDKSNLVICATHNHELNMVMAAYIESLGVEKTIALVAQSQFGNIARKLGVDVCVPLKDTVVDSIMSHLHGKSVTGIHTVSNGDYEIVECDVSTSSKFIGKELKDISRPGEFLILLIKKPGEDRYQLPQGNTILNVGDHIVLIKETDNKKTLEEFSK